MTADQYLKKMTKAKSITYVKKNAKGKIIAYVSADGKSYDQVDASSYVDALSSIDTDIYSNAKIVKKNVKVNKVNTVQISAEIAGEDLGKAMESVFAAIGIGGDGSDNAAIDYSGLKAVKTTIWIDRKTYRPIKITTDMTAFMNGYMTILIQQMQDMGTDDAAHLDKKANLKFKIPVQDEIPHPFVFGLIILLYTYIDI